MFPRKEIKKNARAALKANYWPVVGWPFLLELILNAVVITVIVAILIGSLGAIAFSSLSGLRAALDSSISTLLLLEVVLIVLCLFLNVLSAGQCYFFYKFYSGEKASFGTFFEGCKDGRFWHVFGGMALMTLYVMLWTWLFVLPGAILMGASVNFYLNIGLMVATFIIGLVLYIIGIIFAFVKAYQYSMIPFLLIDKDELTVKECFKATKAMTAGNKFNLFVLDLSFIGWGILAMITCGLLSIFFVNPYMNLAVAGAYDYLKRTRLANPEVVDESASEEAFETEAKTSTDDSMFEE
ncbi:MAG: DUF975 family protein [Pseudobutyrivibrio sp.]|nr:DUF975 family protein [Pseudobutyrivibrio sp.]